MVKLSYHPLLLLHLRACGSPDADMEDREDEIRVQEEIRFHKENPNTCEFCKKKCDVNVDMMEKCVVTGGTHSIPHY